MMKTTGNSVGARVSGAADEAIEATTQALESSRQFATEVAGRIGERARDIGETLTLPRNVRGTTQPPSGD